MNSWIVVIIEYTVGSVLCGGSADRGWVSLRKYLTTRTDLVYKIYILKCSALRLICYGSFSNTWAATKSCLRRWVEIIKSIQSVTLFESVSFNKGGEEWSSQYTVYKWPFGKCCQFRWSRSECSSSGARQATTRDGQPGLGKTQFYFKLEA